MKHYIFYLLCLFVSTTYAQQPDEIPMHPLCVYMVNKYCLNHEALDSLNAFNILNANTFLRDCLTHAGLRKCITQLHNPDQRDHAKKILIDIQTYFKKHLVYVNNYQEARDKNARYWAALSGISFLATLSFLPLATSRSPTIETTSIRNAFVSFLMAYGFFIKWIVTQTATIDIYKISLEKICLDIDELLTI